MDSQDGMFFKRKSVKEETIAPAKVGDTVSVHFTCRLEDGTVYDTSIGKAPVELTIGENRLLPGFEHCVVGMNPGESRTVRITADDAYGAHKDDLVKVIGRAEFTLEQPPEVGMQIRIERNDGGTSFITITDVSETNVTLDANHPLAGKDIFFDIELVAIAKTGPSAGTYYNLGIFFQEQGEGDEAILNYKKAVTVDPNYTEAYYNLGVILHEHGQFDEATECYQKTLQLNPDHLKANINIGNIFRQTGNSDRAIDYYRKALDLNPDHADIHNNLGAVYQDKGSPDQAIPYFQKALELHADFAEACNNLGSALKETGQFEKAREYFQKAIQLNPAFAEAHVNMAYILLLSGSFVEGWKEYEWRFQTEKFDSRMQVFPCPEWDGSPLDGKPLLICAEQGIGDEVMFSSCLPDVIEKAGQCIVECDSRLLQLFSRSFPGTRFFGRNDGEGIYPPELPRAEYKIAMGSLSKYYRSNLDRFPQREAYLLPDPKIVSFWKDRFNQLGKGLKVGISWRGGQHVYAKRARSIPLEEWSAILSFPEIKFINLQYGDCKTELDEIHKGLGIRIHDWDDADPLKDLGDFAAQITALDLVISVDNATVHFAGALGKPVWTLLPYVPEWRWMLNRPDSPWYPTMKLFRQPSPGSWGPVIENVLKDLRLFPKN